MVSFTQAFGTAGLLQGGRRTFTSWGCPGALLGFLLYALSTSHAYGAILRVPQQYQTIRAGLMAATSGDTVLVARGVYYEAVVLKPGVALYGETGAILDGSQTLDPVVTALQGVTRTAGLSGFVIRHGRQAGILLNRADPTLRHNVIMANAGPGIDCAQASPHIVNNAIVENAGGGVVCQYPGTAPLMAYNAFWHNTPEDVMGCPLGEGNRFVAPGFVDASQGDYRVGVGSPLRQAGDPDPAWHNRDGSRSDIGITGGPPPPVETRRAFSASSLFDELFGTSEMLRNSLSAWGMPGIIHVPTATMVPSGSLDLGYNVARDLDVFPGVDRQKTFNFALGFLPRVTLGGRGTVATDRDSDRDLARDLSANVQVLLLDEGGWWPAVALGVQDVGGGASFFRSRYVTLSKSLFGRLRATMGFGLGPDVLEGPFGGVELALNRFVTLLGEYDAREFNAGIRLFPLPEKLEAYGIPRPTVDVIWQEGGHVAWGISVRSRLGETKFQAQQAARAEKRYSRRAADPATAPSFQVISEQLQAALMERGLENVRVSVVRLEASYTVVVEYENRRYNRDELDGLGLVLGLAALHTAPPIGFMSVIVKEVNTPVLQVSTSIEAFMAFLNEQMATSTFAQQLHVTQQVQWPLPTATLEASTNIGQRSWLKVDTFLRPRIATRLLTEAGVADLRFSVVPEAVMQLTPGAVVDVRGVIPVTQTAGFPGPLGGPDLDRALLHQAVRLPQGPWSTWANGLTQVSIGRFNQEEVGIADETAVTFLDGIVFLKGTLARLGPSFTDLNHWVALANGRVRYPAWDLTFSVTAGRFLDGDRGVAADLSRFFGTTEVGVFFRHSDHGSLVGIRFGVPLTPAKELSPWYVRPRLPDLYTYAQQTTVLMSQNIIRGDIGRLLTTDHEIERVYWNRDRLYPVYLRQHVDTLKQAVRRWIDDAS